MRKKRKIYIALILFLACFLFIGEANASNNEICKYSYKKDTLTISYSGAKSKNYDKNSRSWTVSTDFDDSKVISPDSGSYKTVFSTNKETKDRVKFYKMPKEKEFTCPQLCVYTGKFDPGKDKRYYGFTKNSNDCNWFVKNSDFIFGAKERESVGPEYSLFSVLDNEYLTEDKIKEQVNNKDQLCKTREQINGLWTTPEKETSSAVMGVIATNVKAKYFKDDATIPDFIYDYIGAKAGYDKKFISELIDSKCKEDLDNGNIDQQTYDSISSYVNNENYDFFSGTGYTISKEYKERVNTSYGSNVKDPTTDINCNSILGTEMTKLVENALKFIRFLGPVLVIVLTIIDFVSAVFSADLSITKPLGKLIRRLIAAALLFFLPTIIIPLFNYLHITMSDTCMQFLQ